MTELIYDDQFKKAITSNIENFIYLYFEEFNGCWPSRYPCSMSFDEWFNLFQTYLKAQNKYAALKEYGDKKTIPRSSTPFWGGLGLGDEEDNETGSEKLT